jgi:hypothetical protein
VVEGMTDAEVTKQFQNPWHPLFFHGIIQIIQNIQNSWITSEADYGY